MTKQFLSLFFALLFIPQAYAATYVVDKSTSSVTFSGKHAGNSFTGTFKDWNADIVFDSAHLDTSHIKAGFDLSSASTGNKMYDGTLPQADWFDVKEFPKASFDSSNIKANPDHSYTATGNLTIRNITHPVTFVFTLSDLTKTPIKAEGHFTLDRLSYDLGKKSDPKSEWVDPDITVTLAIVAMPAK